MSNEGENKPRLHIHIGGLIVLAIIALIIFKVDIKSKITSPQFQENITFIKEQAIILNQKYIIGPIKSTAGGLIVNYADNKLKEFENNLIEESSKTSKNTTR